MQGPAISSRVQMSAFHPISAIHNQSVDRRKRTGGFRPYLGHGAPTGAQELVRKRCPLTGWQRA